MEDDGSAGWHDVADDVDRAIDTPPDRVHLVVPPSSEYLRTVRLLAADVGARAGLDARAIEELRMAVDELSHLLMRATDHFVALSLHRVPRGVEVDGSAHRRPGAPVALDDISRRIVEFAADGYRVDVSDDAVAFSLVKARRIELAETR